MKMSFGLFIYFDLALYLDQLTFCVYVIIEPFLDIRLILDLGVLTLLWAPKDEKNPLLMDIVPPPPYERIALAPSIILSISSSLLMSAKVTPL